MKFLALIATISAVRVSNMSQKTLTTEMAKKLFDKCNKDNNDILTYDELKACGAPLYDPLFKESMECLSGKDGQLTEPEWMEITDPAHPCTQKMKQRDQEENDKRNHEEGKYSRKEQGKRTDNTEGKHEEGKRTDNDKHKHEEGKRTDNDKHKHEEGKRNFPTNKADAGEFYEKCNKNQDESLSLVELQACGAPLKDRHFVKIFKCLAGKDGLLGKDEFTAAWDRGNVCVNRAKYEEDKYDKKDEKENYDGDGHDHGEGQNNDDDEDYQNNDGGDENPYDGAGDPKQIADHIFKHFDTDKDGFLNRAEVLAGIDKAFTDEMSKKDKEINQERQYTKEKAIRDFVKYSKLDRSDLVRFIRNEQNPN